MIITQATGDIPASFEHTFINPAGETVTETVDIEIKRLMFRKAVSKEFQDAFKRIGENQEEMAALLADMVAKWNIWEDEAKTVKFDITVDNLLDRCTPAFVGDLAECVMSKIVPKQMTPAVSQTGSEPKDSLTNAANL